jgi:ectoine hydroxylase
MSQDRRLSAAETGAGLRESERRAWATDGFFVRPAIFGPAELARLRAAAESVVREAHGALPDAVRYEIDGNAYAEARIGAWQTTVQFEHVPGSTTLRVIEPFHALHPCFDALVDDVRLVDPMRELVGAERIALFTDKLNLKRPREGSGFAWHQDSPYWAHFFRELDRLPNVMLTLDDADEGNGCFRLIRGSHVRGLLAGRTGEGRLGPLFTDPRAFDLRDQVPVVCPAGSLIFFSPHIVHGSEPNHSSAPRRALVITYQPADGRMFKLDAVRNCAQGQAYGGVASVRT